MKYMLLIYADETGEPRYLPEDHQAAHHRRPVCRNP